MRELDDLQLKLSHIASKLVQAWDSQESRVFFEAVAALDPDWALKQGETERLHYLAIMSMHRGGA